MEKNRPIKCFGIPEGVEVIVWDTDAAMDRGKAFQSVCKGDAIKLIEPKIKTGVGTKEDPKPLNIAKREDFKKFLDAQPKD